MPQEPLPQDSGGWGPQRRLRTFPEGWLYAGDVHVQEFFPLTPWPLSGGTLGRAGGRAMQGLCRAPRGESPSPPESGGPSGQVQRSFAARSAVAQA